MKKLTALLCATALVLLTFCSCSFFEKEVTEVELSQTELTMTVGDSVSIEASVLPKEAKTKNFDWTSSAPSVATVEDGTIKGKSKGTAVITAKADNGVKKSCNVTVSDKQIESIDLNPNEVTVKVGKKIQLTYKALPADAPQKSIKWSSSDKSVAVVNSDGFITGIKEGIASVICSADNGVEASCTVIVKENQIKQTVPTSTNPTKPNATQPSNANSIVNTMNSTPQEIGNTYKSDFVFYYSSSQKLSKDELRSLNSTQIQTAINEIYARHGRAFKDSEIKSYFSNMSWYITNPAYSDSELSSIENYNINILSQSR